MRRGPHIICRIITKWWFFRDTLILMIGYLDSSHTKVPALTNKDHQRVMVYPMFMNFQSLRSFLTAVTLFVVSPIMISLPVFTWIYLNLSVFTWIYLNLHKFPWIYLNLPEVTRTYLNIPEFTGVYLNMPKFT